MKQNMFPNTRVYSIRYFLLLFAVIGLLLSRTSAIYAQVGQPWAWGYNDAGQLGDGTNTERDTPVRVFGLSKVIQVVGGIHHSLALKSDGTVWAWGENRFGSLGDGTLTNRNTPVQVSGLAKVTQIAGTDWHSLALKSDGTVWTWGHNIYGQLGNGTNDDSSVPVQVSGLSKVTQVAGGGDHSLALRSNGTVWAWGSNRAGQLGDGTNTSKSIPAQVPGLTGILQIEGGGYHSLALKSDGTVLAWGRNDDGQLGDGTTTSRDVPTQVSALVGVAQISAGENHSLALKFDGTIWVWGSNWAGQLGDGTNTKRYSPVQLSGFTDVVQVAGGIYHSLALKSDGTGWAWGYNALGQLGDGTTTDRNTPVQVFGLQGQTLVAGGNDHSVSVQAFVLDTKISASDITLGYQESITLSASIKNAIGGLLLNEPLIFSLDGTPLGTVHTDASGTARILAPNPLSLSIGKHAFTVSYAGNRLYKASQKTAILTITKTNTTLKTSSVSGRPGDTKTLTATLKRTFDNSALSSTPLTFKIDGNVIGTADTDGTGKAVLSYKFDETYSVGSHSLTVEYAGDDIHKAAIGKGTLKVSKVPTKLICSSVLGRVGATVNLVAVLGRTTDSLLLSGKTVSFTIDGVLAGSVTTDEDGFAFLDYTIPSAFSKGLHVIAVSFDGDNFYLNASASAWLKVK